MKIRSKRAWYENIAIYCMVTTGGMFALSLSFYFSEQLWFALAFLVAAGIKATIGLLSFNKAKEYND